MHLKDFIQEKYSPLFNKTHKQNVTQLLNVVDNYIKNGMSSDEVIEMLQDIINTIKER